MPTPAQGVAYDFYVSLGASADPDTFLANPTIAAGDFKASVDGAAFANLTTLPVVEPSGSISVKISLSATEMSGSKVSVQAIDQAGDEWQNALITIDIPRGSSESVYDLEVGDHVETKERLIINKKGTTTAVLDKTITGSLLSSAVTLSTKDS